MPVCARCEGELIGALIAIIAVWFIRPPYYLMALIMIPMAADGLIQAFTRYESNNWRRLITGMLFGFGAAMILIMLGIACFRYGVGVGAGLTS